MIVVVKDCDVVVESVAEIVVVNVVDLVNVTSGVSEADCENVSDIVSDSDPVEVSVVVFVLETCWVNVSERVGDIVPVREIVVESDSV